MSDEITVTLNFRSKDLGKDATLVLAFDDNSYPRIFSDIFPTVFRVHTFKAQGSSEFSVTFTEKIAFVKVLISGGIVLPTSVYTPIQAGQRTCIIQKGEPPEYSFTPPTALPPPMMHVSNYTPMKQHIGLGFSDMHDSGLSSVLVAKDKEPEAPGYSTDFQFPRILRGYIATGYKEQVLLTTEISAFPLFKEDFVKLPRVTNWKIIYNPAIEKFEIEPDTV